MAIIRIIMRKMLNNRWLTISLFLGLLITVSLVSSIPTYTSSVLQKLLAGELEDYQIEQQEYPGLFSFSVDYSKDEDIDQQATLEKIADFNEELIGDTELSKVTDATILSTSQLHVHDEEISHEKSARMLSFSNVVEHITITDGALPSEQVVDGVYEALVPEKALVDRDMVLGKTLTLTKGEIEFQVKPVGTFVIEDTSDPYWTLPSSAYSNDFMIAESLFKNELLANHEELLKTSKFITAFDYTAFTSEDIPALLSLERQVKAGANAMMETIVLIDLPANNILSSYEQKGNQLQAMLWSLNVPVLVMLAIYLFMVSRLIVGRQLNEIAILASRGAKRTQILFIYFVEVAILGLLALSIGPIIGLQFTKILGSTNGFLEFVNRTALPLELSFSAYRYAFAAVLLSILMIMIPVFIASKQSIVDHKQNKQHSNSSFKWYKLLIDLSLVGIAIYGLLSFQKQQSSTQGEEIYMDPVLFFLPAIFIIGLGLFILRIYPYVLKGIYHLGKKFWSISLYSTFLQVSRSTKNYQFLMLFLIMTIGIGIYSASAARTVNNNLEEQIMYQNGADINLDVRWESNETVTGISSAYEINQEEEEDEVKEVVYTEPPFEAYTKMEGVKQATRVFKKEPVKVTAKGESLFSTELMGIEPNDFGQTAWFKTSLLPHHWYHYLNLLAKEPSSILISKSVSSSLGVEEGDYLTMEWDGSDAAEFVVYGIIDYWPTFNPNAETEEDNTPTFIVANLPYIQNLMGLEPYQVWLDTDATTTRNELYQAIQQEEIPVRALADTEPKLIELKNSSFLLGLNGTLTLGFIISLLITFIGFILYWVLTIKSRTLQYGVYRAMGIPIHKLIRMLAWEQVMTSFFACLLGVIIGEITSRLYVPLFQWSLDAQSMVPPFQVMIDPRDTWRIYLFVGCMLVIGLVILVVLLRKINIHQALKLGED